MFCRGWKSAGPPHPELLPDIDDSDGVNAIIPCALGLPIGTINNNFILLSL